MTKSIRQERVEKLLHELQYEITRGMMEREIDEHIAFDFTVPSKEEGARFVACSFRTRVAEYWESPSVYPNGPMLRVIK